MGQVDYIIVGDGYGAMFFAHQLIRNNKTFKIFSDSQVAASHISAGVCNPLVLKRFAEIWKAEEHLEYLNVIFDEIKTYTGQQYLINEQVVRILHNETEKELWLNKKGIDEISNYLNPNFIKLKTVQNDHESGIVNHSCRINVDAFFKDMFAYLEKQGFLVREKFNYSELNSKTSTYKDFSFKNIVFAEGLAVNNNPYFDDIAVYGNKGHCLKIKIKSQLDPYIMKKKYFLFHWKEDTFFVGGTYERDEVDLEINQNSVKKLEVGLKEIYKGDYQIEEIHTAFRAVVDDRRAILGKHHSINNFYLLNGLGARGVFNGTLFSKKLYNFIENDGEIYPEVDINRFYNNKCKN